MTVNLDGVPAPEAKDDASDNALDTAFRCVSEYLSVTESQAVAVTLFAAATHAVKAFPAFGRLFFGAKTPESGKTAGLNVAALLSSNPIEADGSSYALTATLAEAHNKTETPVPTLFMDEIQDVFGKAGLNTGGKNPIVPVLRKGYKRGATSSWSVQRVREEYSIYMPVIVAGLGTALPVDIRSRSIVIMMERGKPKLDLDSDGSEAILKATGTHLGASVRRALAANREMTGFNCEGAVPKLDGRRHQIWRPLIAVAKFVGGPEWEKRALKAFVELSGTGTEEILSPDQMILRDLASIVTEWEMKPGDFAGGRSLADALSEFDRFEGRSVNSMTQEVARAMPVKPHQKRVNGDDVLRGYYVQWILDAWDNAKPIPADMAETAESVEADAFA